MELKELVQQFDTDKKFSGSYLDNYSKYFNSLRNDELKILELGIFRGGSLKLWNKFFEKGFIVGLDIELQGNFNEDRIITYKGSQDDIKILKRICEENAPSGFDIIIDDCSHIGRLTKKTFDYLFHNHLKKNGIYVIEDWGTGYWNIWPDGKLFNKSKSISFINKLLNSNSKRFLSHDFGMVGFIKQLIDEVGKSDITHNERGLPPHEQSKIKSMEIFPGHVFIVKK